MAVYSTIILFYLSIMFFSFGSASLIFLSRTFIQTLINLEVCMLGVILAFILFSVYLSEPSGQVHALYVVVITAAESCFGLALVIILLRRRGSILFEDKFSKKVDYAS